jgi:hypothetical protein
LVLFILFLLRLFLHHLLLRPLRPLLLLLLLLLLRRPLLMLLLMLLLLLLLLWRRQQWERLLFQPMRRWQHAWCIWRTTTATILIRVDRLFSYYCSCNWRGGSASSSFG